MNFRRPRSLATVLSRLARLIDARPGCFLPLWILAYWVIVIPSARRPLWYDELHTYYIATAPTLGRLLESSLHADLNPPLSYLAVRGSVALFGDSPLSVRLPFLMAFLAAGLAMYEIVRPRFGGGYALLALGLSWSCGFLPYAVEARPYALALAFFSLAALGWLRAIAAERWGPAHWVLLTGLAGMLLSHCFAPLFAMAIGIGEIVRSIVQKRIDARIWRALLTPAIVALAYVPLIRNARGAIAPPALRASALSLVWIYPSILMALGPFLLLMLLGALIMPRPQGAAGLRRLIYRHEAAFGMATLLVPALLILYFIGAGGAFAPRYVSGVVLGVTLALTTLVAYKADRAPGFGVLAATLVLARFLVSGAYLTPAVPSPAASTIYRSIRADLPFVAANGFTFLEMDNREATGFVRRLYYLSDPAAAFRYTHTNVFNGLIELPRWFPMRAHVLPYAAFVQDQRRFLVFSTPGYPADWLLAKLNHDGAEIRLLAEMKTSYRDGNLYEVTMCGAIPPGAAGK